MKFSLQKIILIVWLIFSVLYVGYTQYRYWQNVVAANAYNQGLSNAVNQVIEQAQKCDPFPVNVGQRRVELINVTCLQQKSQ